jgi:hypothetical protein
MPFNIMKIELSASSLILSKDDGEALINILQRALDSEYDGTEVKPAHDCLTVLLLRFEDLSEPEQKLYQKLHVKPLFKQLSFVTAGPHDDRIEEPPPSSDSGNP